MEGGRGTRSSSSSLEADEIFKDTRLFARRGRRRGARDVFSGCIIYCINIFVAPLRFTYYWLENRHEDRFCLIQSLTVVGSLVVRHYERTFLTIRTFYAHEAAAGSMRKEASYCETFMLIAVLVLFSI